MVSINKVLTKINFTEMLDYSGFAKEPQKVMQRGLMHVGETGVMLTEDLVLCINNKEAFDKHLMSLAYSKGNPIGDQIKMGTNIINGMNLIKNTIKRDISLLYSKRNLMEMVDVNKNLQSSCMKRVQDDLRTAQTDLWDYPGNRGPKYDNLIKDYNQKLDAYHSELASSLVLRDTLNEIVDAHKNRPLNKFAKFFGI